MAQSEICQGEKDVNGNQSEMNWLAVSFELGWLVFFFPTVITFFFLLDFCGNTVLFYCTEVLLQTAVDLAAKILVLCFSLALADLGFVVLGA